MVPNAWAYSQRARPEQGQPPPVPPPGTITDLVFRRPIPCQANLRLVALQDSRTYQ